MPSPLPGGLPGGLRFVSGHRLGTKEIESAALVVEEVAEALQISVQNAYVVKHRAVERLKTFMVSRGK